MRGSCEGSSPLQVRMRSILQRKGLAPAVLADLTLDDLASGRRLEQRAQAAAIDTVRRVLIFGLRAGHLVGSAGGRDAREDCGGGPLKRRAARPVHSRIGHGALPLSSFL